MSTPLPPSPAASLTLGSEVELGFFPSEEAAGESSKSGGHTHHTDLPTPEEFDRSDFTIQGNADNDNHEFGVFRSAYPITPQAFHEKEDPVPLH